MALEPSFSNVQLSLQYYTNRVIGKITESRINTVATVAFAAVGAAWVFRGDIYKVIHSDIGSWFFGKNVVKQTALHMISSTISISDRECHMPQLPVPALEDTMRRFLETRRPLLSDSDYLILEEQVEQFCRGKGPLLQRMVTGFALLNGRHQDYSILLRPFFLVLATWYGQSLNTDYYSGWFEDTWMKVAYLRGRTPLFFTNWFSPSTSLDIAVDCSMEDLQIQKSAYMIKSFLRHMQNILHDRGNYALEARLQMSMRQYERVIGSYQVPDREMDSLQYNFSKRRQEHSNYVLIVYKGYYFPLTVFHENGREYSLEEVNHQLMQIKRKLVDASSSPHEIGVLSADDRTLWAANRERLMENPDLQKKLEIMEGALFPIFIDEGSPTNPVERSRAAQCRVHNRFFGYAIGPIIFENGTIAIENTHSMGEAHIVALAGETSIDYMASIATHVGEGGMFLPCIAEPSNTVALEQPEALDFSACLDVTRTTTTYDKDSMQALKTKHKLTDLDVPESGSSVTLREEIERVITLGVGLGGDLDIQYRSFDGFGMDQIKKWRLSPDTFFQVAIQLGWYSVTNHFDFTYQTGSTRLFKGGRTETIHPLSMPMKAFVLHFLSESADSSESKRLLQAVMQQHRRDKEDAMSGKGSHRHIVALNVVAAIKQIEDPFLASWDMPLTIATSQTPFRVGYRDRTTTPFRDGGERENDGGGFVPYAHNGVGISYKMKDEGISFFLTTFRSNEEFTATQLVDAICLQLRALENLCSTR